MVDRAVLARCIERGRAAFPTLTVAPDAVVAWFEERLAALVPLPSDDRIPAEDLFLACACAAGGDDVVAVFADRHLPRLAPALRHAGLDDDGVAEVQQALIALLFVGDGDGPHVRRYAGRGDLHGWLKSIAVRLALRRRQRDHREVGDDALVDLAVERDDDPRLAHWKRTAAGELRDAFAAAMTALDPRERTLLRQHHLDGLTLDQLAAGHGVHRATVARWLAAARQRLADRTRDELIARLRVAPEEVASVVRLVASQLDLSLRRLLHSQ